MSVDDGPAGPRARAIDAALALIGEHGVAALDERSALAAAARLAEPEFAELFPDQRELLRAALRQRVEGQIERFGILAAGMRRNPPSLEGAAGAMEGVVWSAIDRAEEIAELEIHLQAARDPTLQEDARRAFTAYEEFAAAVLAGLGLPSGPGATRLAITLFHGLALRRLSTGEADARGTYEALIVLARGLAIELPS